MSWRVFIKSKAEKDLAWFRQNNLTAYKKCYRLISEINHDPRTGMGKPERLKYFTQEVWSRRITREHRLIYVVDTNRSEIDIVSCRSHYEGVRL